MSLAEKIALERGIVIPDETKTNSAAMSAWIRTHLSAERGKGRHKSAHKPANPTVSKSPATKRSRMRSRKKASNPAIPMTIVR